MRPFLYLQDNRKCPVESVTRKGRRAVKCPSNSTGVFFEKGGRMSNFEITVLFSLWVIISQLFFLIYKAKHL